MKNKLVVSSVVMIVLWAFSANALTLKVGVLAPDGSSWAKFLKGMSKEIKNATKGDVKIKMYLGGSLGDEPDVLRKIRVGQVHGGLFTGKTLGDINGDVRLMEVPFTFNENQKKADTILKKLAPEFSKGFNAKGFENLGFFKLGYVYFVAKKKTPTLESLKSIKIWAWEGDPVVETMIKQMKLISVPLPLPDVLSSLTTGIIDAAYASPMGIIALQWNSKIKYVLDFPVAYSIGAFLIDKKKWAKVKPAHQILIKNISKKYIEQMNKSTVRENIEALEIMKKMGVETISFGKKDMEEGIRIRKRIIKELDGKLFSSRMVKKFKKMIP